MMKKKLKIDPASFRDKSGFVYYDRGEIYRQINYDYKENYDLLMRSGLYENLTRNRYLISHEEAALAKDENFCGYKKIKPEDIPMISYPYEWCFSQLKEAALLTLDIQKISMDYGMSLKDASAYNIQFYKGKPIFIDTLSFEKYKVSEPWVAYRQFCQHFFAPLALMSLKDARFNQLFKIFIDGIPLDLASSLLSFRTFANLSLLAHIHIHAKSQKHFASKSMSVKKYKMSHKSFLGLIDNLESSIKKMEYRYIDSEWSNYYDNTNYSSESLLHKSKIIESYLERIKPSNVWDLGANDGKFSRIASNMGVYTIAFDYDHDAVEKNWHQCRRMGEKMILPLMMDLANPSSGIGWNNSERLSLTERGGADAVFALALIHHLRITNNIPLENIAEYFRHLSEYLIIEFIPKSDSQVKKILSTREDIFMDYHQSEFEVIFKKYFYVIESIKIIDSERILYLMRKNEK
ncbi:MAG: SAM-dependent methyltransferase [Flavobacterium sp.]|nr:SAM-dependent methyltransferase [Flavobacterium sp.]